MRNIATIVSKELKSYVISLNVYLVAMVFLAITDFLFYQLALRYSFISTQLLRTPEMAPQVNLHDMVFRPVYHNMSVILIFIVPALTMRLFAEEKKSRTTELLMTSPISITELVLGKFLAVYIVYGILLALTLHMPLILSGFSEVNWRPLLATYLGLLLLGGVFTSLGLFASSLTENQIIAAVISFGMFLLLWLIGITAQNAGSTQIEAVVRYLSIIEHFDNFTRGLLDSRDLVYFVSLITLGLFSTHRVLESQRWK